MRFVLPFLFLWAPLFGQGTTKNAAEQNLRDRIKTLTLRSPEPPVRLTLNVVRPACAIPLVTVAPSGNYKMPVSKPSQRFHGEDTALGAPACDSKFFENR